MESSSGRIWHPGSAEVWIARDNQPMRRGQRERKREERRDDTEAVLLRSIMARREVGDQRAYLPYPDLG